MPGKKMARRSGIDDASEELLGSMLGGGPGGEESNEGGFTDMGAEFGILPTNEELAILIGSRDNNCLPIQEILKRNLHVTLRAIELAEIAYHKVPKQSTAVALTNLQNVAKELIESLEERQDPAVLLNRIKEQALRPLIFDFVKTLTSEAERKRSALVGIVDPERVGVVSHEMKDLLKGVQQGLDEAVDSFLRKLSELLGTS